VTTSASSPSITDVEQFGRRFVVADDAASREPYSGTEHVSHRQTEQHPAHHAPFSSAEIHRTVSIFNRTAKQWQPFGVPK
jgi:hypothetical protein